MNMNKLDDLDWDKMQGLLPAIIQDEKTLAILMVGYMNKEALQKTLDTQFVTFYSRSKKRIWQKGEVSGNRLKLIRIHSDCDNDAILIHALPTGPVCHTGQQSCFSNSNSSNSMSHTGSTDLEFLLELEALIAEREILKPEGSYISKLFDSGISRIAQKVGEEAVECALASIDKDDKEFASEVADLLFHVLILLRARKITLSDVTQILKKRRINK